MLQTSSGGQREQRPEDPATLIEGALALQSQRPGFESQPSLLLAEWLSVTGLRCVSCLFISKM